MEKNETIKFLRKNHKSLAMVLEGLIPEQFLKFHIIKSWNVKDIIAHISAWNIELNKAIEKVLNNQEIWFREKKETEIFNKIQVSKRKSFSIKEIIEEWEKSFEELINRMQQLSAKEWNHVSSCKWSNGDPISVKSLFLYRYRNKGHEGGHADQIEKYFEEEACDCRLY